MTDSIEQFTGDAAAARALRQSLTVLAENEPESPLTKRITEVLNGRRDFRDLATDPEFASLAQRGMQQFSDQWEASTPEEREALVAEGRAAESAVRAEDTRRGQ